MPRMQVFITPKLYPGDEPRTPEQQRVAAFLAGLRPFVAKAFEVPEPNVRIFVAPRSEFDSSPVDVDITVSIKVPSDDGLTAMNQKLYDFAHEALGPDVSVGSHLYILSDDAWQRSNA